MHADKEMRIQFEDQRRQGSPVQEFFVTDMQGHVRSRRLDPVDLSHLQEAGDTVRFDGDAVLIPFYSWPTASTTPSPSRILAAKVSTPFLRRSPGQRNRNHSSARRTGRDLEA